MSDEPPLDLYDRNGSALVVAPSLVPVARRQKAVVLDDAKLPPHDLEAEQGALGAILLAPREGMDLCAEKTIVEDSFFDLRHGTLYARLCEMHSANEPMDLITLQSALKVRNQLEGVGGMAYLSCLMDSAPSSHALPSYLETLRAKHTLRKLLRTCHDVQARIREHEGNVEVLLNDVEADIQRSSEQHFSGGQSKTLTPKQAAVRFHDDLKRRFDLQGRLSGIGTGFRYLDKMTGGLQAGELAVIGARPSAGKTAIAGAIVAHACLLNGLPTAFVTLEMRESAIIRRLAAAKLKISITKLRDGDLSESDFKQLIGFSAAVSKSSLHFIDGVSGISIAQISSELRRLVRKHGVKLVVIDYLQKIKPAAVKEKRTYEVGAVSEGLKGLAASLNIAIVALAQLSREPDKDKGRRPRLSDLADSAQIERDGDLIGLLHRPRTEKDPKGEKTELIVAKQRDGEVGIIDLNFDAKYCQFTDANECCV